MSHKKMKHAINQKKHNSSSYSDDPSSSQDDLLGNTRNVFKRHNCNEQQIVNYPSSTTPHAKLTFSNSNAWSEPSKDLGNLLADHTQSEITAKLSNPELSGAFLNSVNSSFKNKKEESLR